MIQRLRAVRQSLSACWGGTGRIAAAGLGHGRRHDAGFTLLEVLVSLLLMALVTALLPGALHLGQRALNSGEPLQRSAAIMPARQFLSQRLAEAHVSFKRDAAGKIALDFSGEQAALSFVAPAVAAAREVGLVRYSLRSDNAGHPVRVVMQSLAVGAAGTPAPLSEALLDTATSALSFRYFGRGAGEERPSWHDTWKGEAELPRLVEVTFRHDAAAAATPETLASVPLIVELALAAN